MKKIVKKLKKYAKRMGNWVKPVDSPRRLKRFEANAFIIGVLLDQRIVAERAWSSGKWDCGIARKRGRRFWTLGKHRENERKENGWIHALWSRWMCISHLSCKDGRIPAGLCKGDKSGVPRGSKKYLELAAEYRCRKATT